MYKRGQKRKKKKKGSSYTNIGDDRTHTHESRHFLIHVGPTHNVRVDEPMCHQNLGKVAFFL